MLFNIVNFVFRSNKGFDDTGFGSLYDGSDVCGNLDNISTQAVMNLMKNVSCKVFDDNVEFVEIADHDVQEHHIPRTEVLSHQGSNLLFVFVKIYVFELLICFFD